MFAMGSPFNEFTDFSQFQFSSGLEPDDGEGSMENSIRFDSLDLDGGFLRFRNADLSTASPTLESSKNNRRSNDDSVRSRSSSHSAFDIPMYNNNNLVSLSPPRKGRKSPDYTNGDPFSIPLIQDDTALPISFGEDLDKHFNSSESEVLDAIPIVRGPVMAQAIESDDEIQRLRYRQQMKDLKLWREEQQKVEARLLEKEQYKKQLEAIHAEYLSKQKAREEKRQQEAETRQMQDLRQIQKERVQRKQKTLQIQQLQDLFRRRSDAEDPFEDEEEEEIPLQPRRYFISSRSQKYNSPVENLSQRERLAVFKERLSAFVTRKKTDIKTVQYRQKLATIRIARNLCEHSCPESQMSTLSLATKSHSQTFLPRSLLQYFRLCQGLSGNNLSLSAAAGQVIIDLLEIDPVAYLEDIYFRFPWFKLDDAVPDVNVESRIKTQVIKELDKRKIHVGKTQSLRKLYLKIVEHDEEMAFLLENGVEFPSSDTLVSVEDTILFRSRNIAQVKQKRKEAIATLHANGFFLRDPDAVPLAQLEKMVKDIPTILAQ